MGPWALNLQENYSHKHILNVKSQYQPAEMEQITFMRVDYETATPQDV